MQEFTRLVHITVEGEDIAYRNERKNIAPTSSIRNFILWYGSPRPNVHKQSPTVEELIEIISDTFNLNLERATEQTIRTLRALDRRGLIITERVPAFAPFTESAIFMEFEEQGFPLEGTVPIETEQIPEVGVRRHPMFGTMSRRVGRIAGVPETIRPIEENNEI